jgi:hypothetical protein
MWKIVLASLLFSLNTLAAAPGPIVWGNNNNALYLPTNVPSSGVACLTVDPLGVISPQTCGSGGGGGTVTSVSWGSLPSWLVGTGSPITTSGSLGLTLSSQTANRFLASPNGSAGALSPRAIVAADIPTLNQNTTGSAGSLNSTFNAGLPLIGNGSGIPAVASKSGNTTTFATTSGTLVSGHGVQIDASGNLIDTGVVPGVAAGVDQSVQYKGPDGLFTGDSFFKYDYTAHALHVPDIYLGQGQDVPAGFTHDNKIEPWARTGSHKTLVNTDDSPIVAGFCYVFDSSGNFVSSGIPCTPVSGSQTVVITTDYTPVASSVFVVANCASQCQVNLPDASAIHGYQIAMKNIGPANAIFHNMAGQTIDNQNDWALLPDKEEVNLISVGGTWYVY